MGNNGLRKWKILSYATGYSSIYCRLVVDGKRSRVSKGGKIIMKKYEELNDLLGH